ncbi:MAG: hypothetical protein SFX73_39960 [Kofleriaceae bacterium]|nr:hypothetical protein [Kofleriaceae bacterium]
MKLLGTLCVLVACGSGPANAPALEADPSGWRCYTRDPAQPALPQGDVTHTRSRFADGRLELESINTQGGQAGATRIVFTPVGDHLEANFRGVPVLVRMDTLDNWTLSYSDPKSGLAFQEKNKVVNGVLTVTTTEPTADGSARETAVRYLAAPCSVVVAELAKYPPPAP